MSSPVRLGPNDLLEYDANHGVIICRECQYAIQKSALQSHLLRHKIFRHERHSLLSFIDGLNILEPDDVPLPLPTSKPIEALPVVSGFRCTLGICDSLYASSKRMRRHQLESHSEVPELDSGESTVRSVDLQTFFRGTKIRYFEVATNAKEAPKSSGSLKAATKESIIRELQDTDDVQMHNAGVAEPSNPSQPPQSALVSGIDLHILNYFHHFTSTTSLTLLALDPNQLSSLYWQEEFVAQALRQEWLMAGLVAVAASHMGTSAHQSSTASIHYSRSDSMYFEFLRGRETNVQSPFNTSHRGKPTPCKEVLDQVDSIMQCARVLRASEGPAALEDLIKSMHGLISNSPAVTWPDDIQQNDEDAFSRAARLFKNPASDFMLIEILKRLETLPTRMAQALGRPGDLRDVFTALSAVATLVDSCVTGFEAEEYTFRAMVTWLTRVGEEFHQMLAQNQPAALVVLAHWAASLVRRVEENDCWFLKGASDFLLHQIAERLPPDHAAIQQLIEDL